MSEMQHHEFEIMRDTWEIYKTHYEPCNDDAYWDELFRAFSAIARKYPDSHLPTYIADAYLKDIEERYNEMLKKEAALQHQGNA